MQTPSLLKRLVLVDASLTEFEWGFFKVERSGTEVVKSTVLSELLDELHGTEADHVVTAAIVSCQEELRRDDLHKRIGGIFPQRFSNPHKFKRFVSWF